MPVDYDLIFAGGGLSAVLTALRVRGRWPDARIRILESQDRLGGNHTWSFHSPDVSTADLEFLMPLIAHTWPRQTVRFPSYERILETPYHSVSAERFEQVATRELGDCITLGAAVQDVRADGVSLEDGTTLTAPCVFDCRGPLPSPNWALAFQSFVGLTVELYEPHGLTAPVIMDATVEQKDGYRFVYLLPFDTHHVMVEDTYYADGSGLAVEVVKQRIFDYIAEKRWRVKQVCATETGVLPLMLAGDPRAFWRDRKGEAVPLGLRAALFHPVTGYSLPDAVATARLVADVRQPTSAKVLTQLESYALKRWRRQGFYRMLNRMLFLGADDQQRRTVLERFYTLAEPLVERFYAGRSSKFDEARILVGKPPIPIHRALKAIWPSAARARVKLKSDAGAGLGSPS